MLDDKLYKAALAFLEERFGGQPWKGVAAMYTASGRILLSTAPECLNDSASLCHETGALCEAYKLDEDVAASICISRDDRGVVHVLTPCGICQERLFFYGPGVEVAVPAEKNSSKWTSKKLADIQPYYWRKPFDQKKTGAA